MHRARFYTLLRLVFITALLSILASCTAPLQVQPRPTPALDADVLGHLNITTPALPTPAAQQPLPALQGTVAPGLSTLSLTGSSRVELRLLVVSANATDPGLNAVTTLLGTMGLPYETLIADRDTLTEARLVAANGDGRFQGVVLTDGSLAHFDGNDWGSAFSGDEWNLLWDYEQAFKVRQLTLYAYPGTYPEDYGLRVAGYQDTNAAPYPVALTNAGRSVFKSVQPTAKVPLRYAYTYLTQVEPTSGVSATPLLQDAAGNTVAALAPSQDGRERLVLTTAQSPYLLHTQLFGYDLVNWVTRGVFLGQRKAYLQVDVDDWFSTSDRWNADTRAVDEDVFRMSASDALATLTQQTALQSRFPLARDFKYVQAFNGAYANPSAPASCDPNAPSPDPLTSVTRCMAANTYWLNHTYHHDDMDFSDYNTSKNEIVKNNRVAKDLGFTVAGTYRSRSLLTGGHSGLGYYYDAAQGRWVEGGLNASNQALLDAAYASGVRYMGSNYSLLSNRGVCSSCGVRHPLKPGIMLLPRYPTNVFYNVTDPDEALSEYNYIYGPGGVAPYWDHDLDYDEYLQAETDIALYHLLGYSPYPHFFHQANLNEYEPGRSLIYDWLERLAARYSDLSTVPLVTVKWDDLAKSVDRRTSFFEAGAAGVWDRSKGQVTLTSTNGGYVLATGVVFGSRELYAGETLAQRNFAPGEVRTYRVVAQ
ncbi:hypothetical protein BH24DEI2_BH24DEI2_14180 [soil metagenome]